MDYLDKISVEHLQGAPGKVEGNKPTQRLLAAITHKNSVTQAEFAEWHDTGRRATYNWLIRLNTDEPLQQVACNFTNLEGKKFISN